MSKYNVIKIWFVNSNMYKIVCYDLFMWINKCFYFCTGGLMKTRKLGNIGQIFQIVFPLWNSVSWKIVCLNLWTSWKLEKKVKEACTCELV